MADYYAYLIGVDGRVSKRVPIVCDDDEEAKRFANQMVDGQADRRRELSLGAP